MESASIPRVFAATLRTWASRLGSVSFSASALEASTNACISFSVLSSSYFRKKITAGPCIFSLSFVISNHVFAFMHKK
jgi:hypothetical protein